MRRYSKNTNQRQYGNRYKKSHENFIKELIENNEGYKNGNFTVVGKFRGVKEKVILKDKYGYCAVSAYDLIKGVTQKMTIKSAMFKTEYLKEYLKQNNKNFYKYNYRIISNYKTAKDNIIIVDKYNNLHKIKPTSLLKGSEPSIKSAVNKKEFIFNKICRRNSYFKSGEVVFKDFYNYNQKTILVVEDEFGLYNMDITTAYTGSKPTIEIAVDKKSNLINRLKKNGNDYDYSKVEYTKMNDKVTITCKKHGDFKQRSFNHIRGEGCPKCGKESMVTINAKKPTGWSYTNWIKAAKKSKNFDSFKVYIVKMKSLKSNEEFYKIGKTFLTIKNRFRHIKNYKIVEIVCIFESDNGRIITEKEANLLRKNKKYAYTPEQVFRGYKECFIKVEYD